LGIVQRFGGKAQWFVGGYGGWLEGQENLKEDALCIGPIICKP